MAAGSITRAINALEDRKERTRIRKAEETRLQRVETAMGAKRHRQMILDFTKTKETNRHNVAMETQAQNRNKASAAKLGLDMVSMLQSSYNMNYKNLAPGTEETPQMLDTRRSIGLMMSEILGQGQSPKTSLDASTLTPITKPDDVNKNRANSLSILGRMLQSSGLPIEEYQKAVLEVLESDTGALPQSLELTQAPPRSLDITESELAALSPELQEETIAKNVSFKLEQDVDVKREKGLFKTTTKITSKKKDKESTARFKVGSIHAGSDLGLTGDKANKRFTVVTNKDGKLKVKAAK